MNTPIEQGLYTDGNGRVCEIVPHPEEGRGWLAYAVAEIIRRRTTRGGEDQIIRANKPPMRVTLEFWLMLQPFLIEPPPPNLERLVDAVKAAHAPTAPRGSDGAVSA